MVRKIRFLWFIKAIHKRDNKFFGLSIQTTEDAFIYDYEKEKSTLYLLNRLTKRHKLLKKNIY